MGIESWWSFEFKTVLHKDIFDVFDYSLRNTVSFLLQQSLHGIDSHPDCELKEETQSISEFRLQLLGIFSEGFDVVHKSDVVKLIGADEGCAIYGWTLILLFLALLDLVEGQFDIKQ